MLRESEKTPPSFPKPRTVEPTQEKSTLSNGLDLFLATNPNDRNIAIQPVLHQTGERTHPGPWKPRPAGTRTFQIQLSGSGIVFLYAVILGGFFIFYSFSEAPQPTNRVPLTTLTQTVRLQSENSPIERAVGLRELTAAHTPSPPLEMLSSPSEMASQLPVTKLAHHPVIPATDLSKTNKTTGLAVNSRNIREKNKPFQTNQVPQSAQYLFLTRQQDPLILAQKALSGGDLVTARKQFTQMLDQESSKETAMAGIAAIELREHRNERALTVYRDILRDNPKSTLAIAADKVLSRSTQPSGETAELQRLLRSAPDATHLHFALGTLYAEQQDWTAAQESFLKALRRDPTNPDILCNLAIIQDQQNQNDLALHYYGKALKAITRRGGAGFETGKVQRRMALLEQREGRTGGNRHAGDQHNSQ